MLDRAGLRRRPYVLKTRNGAALELRPGMGDLFGFYEIMLRKDYTANGQRIEAGATVIDVGANVGCFSVLASQVVGASGRVIAVEPEPMTFQQLLRNIALNRLGNVTAVQMAVGAEKGNVTLHGDRNKLFSSLFSSVNGREVEGSDVVVGITTLQALMDEQGIARCDYLKLDCEGAEHDIVAHMSPSLAERVNQITMEIHKVPGRDGRMLQANLERLGYQRVGDAGLPFYSRKIADAAAVTESN
jgi:FkbM family methyltransferase